MSTHTFFKIRRKSDGLYWTSNFTPLSKLGKAYENKRGIAAAVASITRYHDIAKFECVQFEAMDVRVEALK